MYNKRLHSDKIMLRSYLTPHYFAGEAKRYGHMMNRLISVLIVLSFPLLANASQEGVLSFSDFSINSNGIGESGPVNVAGSKNEKGEFSSMKVNAFGKAYSFPDKILSQIKALNQNGIQLTYEAGYRSLGGKTIYIQFQTGFTTGVRSNILVSVSENGSIKVLNE